MRIEKSKIWFVDGTFHHPSDFKQPLILMYKDYICSRMKGGRWDPTLSEEGIISYERGDIPPFVGNGDKDIYIKLKREKKT